jgi:hypothetical protein
MMNILFFIFVKLFENRPRTYLPYSMTPTQIDELPLFVDENRRWKSAGPPTLEPPCRNEASPHRDRNRRKFASSRS